jgi:hypothetical protein
LLEGFLVEAAFAFRDALVDVLAGPLASVVARIGPAVAPSADDCFTASRLRQLLSVLCGTP